MPLNPQPAPESNTFRSAPISRWHHIARSPGWMVLIGFTLRVLYIAIAHSYRFRTTDANFSFGWEIGRIAYSLANGHGFSSPFGGDTGPSAWTAPVYPWIVSLAFRAFGTYSHAASFALLTFNSLCSALTCWPSTASPVVFSVNSSPSGLAGSGPYCPTSFTGRSVRFGDQPYRPALEPSLYARDRNGG